MAVLQHGHVLRSQLLAAGLGRGAIAHRLTTGWLREVFPSVYRVGGSGTDRLGRIMAVALSFGGDGLVAGADAADLWSMLDTTQQPPADAPVHVLLVGRSARPRPGVTIRRAGSLDRRDIRRRNGIPITSPARTMLDCAAELDELELEALLAASLRKNLLRRSQLAEVMERNPRARGIGILRALLEQGESLADTRSKYERKLLKLLKAAELPTPITNIKIAGKTVDAYWPELSLVLEVDGWMYHRDKFEKDRVRDQQLLIAGCRAVRSTRTQIDFRPYALVARLAAMITTLTPNDAHAERDRT